MPEQKADVEVDFAVRLPRSRIDHDSLVAAVQSKTQGHLP